MRPTIAILFAFVFAAVGTADEFKDEEPAKMGVRYRPTDKGAEPKGCRLIFVQPNSPAEKAGLKVGDIVTSLDGKATQASPDFKSRMKSYRPGERVR